MFTIPQVAEKLECKPAHVRRLIDEGELGFVDLSLGQQRRALRVTQEQLDKFISERSGIRSRCLTHLNEVTEAVA